MRRHEKAGISRGDLQRRVNEARWAESKLRGFEPHESFTVADRFRELGRAENYRYRQMAWRTLPRTPNDGREREMVKRCLLAARGCSKPILETSN
ncbi:hypothetical protein [Hoeflea sp.]|uniref:hypothetical protein n=1 Tax=Hoeflea sp. TaxID=1940281 RepID=UPI003B52B2C7